MPSHYWLLRQIILLTLATTLVLIFHTLFIIALLFSLRLIIDADIDYWLLAIYWQTPPLLLITPLTPLHIELIRQPWPYIRQRGQQRHYTKPASFRQSQLADVDYCRLLIFHYYYWLLFSFAIDAISAAFIDFHWYIIFFNRYITPIDTPAFALLMNNRY